MKIKEQFNELFDRKYAKTYQQPLFRILKLKIQDTKEVIKTIPKTNKKVKVELDEVTDKVLSFKPNK